MIFTIRKGKHRSRPWRLGLWWHRSQFSWVVKFDESCRHDLGSDDQLDTNKLVGVGYFPHHHKDSARFGWRYSVKKGKVEILAYCYSDSQRTIDHLADAFIGESYTLTIEVVNTGYWLSVRGPGYISEKIYRHAHNKHLKYGLWPYFGGNKTAPHDIRIDLQKLG